MEYLWNTYGIPMDYGISMIIYGIWNVYGMSMERLWNVYGISMEQLWYIYIYICMKSLEYDRNINDYLWNIYGISIIITEGS